MKGNLFSGESYKQVRIEELITDTQLREVLSDLNKSWESEKARLEIASRLAFGLLLVFGFAVICSGIVISVLAFAYGDPDKGIEQMRDFFNMLLPYIATPLGIALGYFFREPQGGS
ncbi:MAG: hypothetical protein ACE5OS_12855 [Anaerolineae bacterium]